ncbi:MAG: hypothetical protein AB7G48_18035 [Nitrospiraceae bacterium]
MFPKRRCGSRTFSLVLRSLICGACFSLAACGSDDSSPPPTSSTGAAAIQPTQNVQVREVPLSATGADRFLGVTTAPDGSVLAVGIRTILGTTDTEIAVAKFDSQGNLDPTFGVQGIASVNATVGGNTSEQARGIVVQSDGKVVVSGVAQHDIASPTPFNLDNDVVVARFNKNGTLDTTFGNAIPPNGIARLDLSTGVQTSATAVRGDTSWGMAVLPNDKLIISASKITSATGRNDNAFAAVQLTKDGILDNTFGVNNNGIAEVDVPNANDQARSVSVLPDGRIVVGGYAPGIPSAPGVVIAILYRLNSNGTFDGTFNGTCAAEVAPCPTGLVAVKNDTKKVTEAYEVGFQSGGGYVFTGYGDSQVPTSPTTVDFLVGRLLPSGAPDATFGTGGFTLVDVAGLSDHTRALRVLSDDSILLVGQSRSTADNYDALVASVLPNGQRNNAFNGTGVRLFDFGGKSDALSGIALSPDGRTAYAVGYKSDPAPQGLDANDDARLVILPLSLGGS